MNKLDIRNLRLVDFVYNFNKTCQRFLDMTSQGGRSYYYSNASQKKSHLSSLR